MYEIPVKRPVVVSSGIRGDIVELQLTGEVVTAIGVSPTTAEELESQSVEAYKMTETVYIKNFDVLPNPDDVLVWKGQDWDVIKINDHRYPPPGFTVKGVAVVIGLAGGTPYG